MSLHLNKHIFILISMMVFFMVFVFSLLSRDRSRERHKASSSKDSSRSERSVVINPPDTPSQDSPVHNEEPLPGDATPAADQGEDAQVFIIIAHQTGVA